MMPLLMPNAGLTRGAKDDGAGGSFVLASAEWATLQVALQSVLALPSGASDFEQRYGSAASGTEIRACFDAMRALRGVAEGIGNPARFRAAILRDPDLLAGAVPPDDVYARTLWTVSRAKRDAGALSSGLRSIPEAASGGGTAEAVKGIREFLLGPDQVADRLQRTIEDLDRLIAALDEKAQRLGVAQEAMGTYTAASSRMRASLTREIGAIEASVADLERQRDDAFAKWQGLTAAACIVPALIAVIGTGILIVTVAVSVPLTGPGAVAGLAWGTALVGATTAAAATGLGTAAGIARTGYEGLVQKVGDARDLRAKRVAYRHDLGALDGTMKFSLPTTAQVIGQVRTLRGGWQGALDEVRFRANELTPASLDADGWLDRGTMGAAANRWRGIEEAMDRFLINGFVDSELLPFGAPLPQADPNWRATLEKRIAA